MMFKGIPMLIFLSTHEEHVFNVDKYVRLLCSDKSGFVQWDKIIEGNGCKYYLSVSILYLAGQPVLLLNYQQLNYDSPPIANKFSFIILQNKQTASSFLRLICNSNVLVLSYYQAADSAVLKDLVVEHDNSKSCKIAEIAEVLHFLSNFHRGTRKL